MLNEKILTIVIEKMPFGVVIADSDFNVLLWNQKATEMVGVTLDKAASSVWHGENKVYEIDKVTQLSVQDMPMYKAIANKETSIDRRVYVTGVKKNVYLNINAFPILDEAGNLVRAAVIMTDITKDIKVQNFVNELGAMLDDVKNTLRHSIQEGSEAVI